MTRVLCILNKSYILSHGDDLSDFFNRLLDLIGDRQYGWFVGETMSIGTVFDFGYDLSDIHPNLHGLTLDKEMGFCYFMLGRNLTSTGKNENSQYKTEKYKHQDISKLISEGIFIEDNRP